MELGKKIETTGNVNEAVRRFLQEIRDVKIPLKQIGLSIDMNEAIGFLESIYI